MTQISESLKINAVPSLEAQWNVYSRYKLKKFQSDIFEEAKLYLKSNIPKVSDIQQSEIRLLKIIKIFQLCEDNKCFFIIDNYCPKVSQFRSEGFGLIIGVFTSDQPVYLPLQYADTELKTVDATQRLLRQTLKYFDLLSQVFKLMH